jgi:alpha-1,6-mannosyltransferase
VKIDSGWKVCGFGGILLMALIFCSRHFADRGGPYFMAALTVAGVAYLLTVRELFAAPKFDRRVVVVGLVLAALWNIVFLAVPAGEDDDIHRYVWDGRLQRLGFNPYLVIPAAASIQKLHTPETRNLNNPDLPSPYPPGAQFFFRVVTAIHESTFAMKVAFVVCEWLIVWIMLDGLRFQKQGAHLVLAYAWNPLLAIEVAGSGHIDIVGALLLVLSVAALLRRWRSTAAVAFGFAVAVKFLPIVLLPLFWKRIRIRDAALAVAVVALLYVPFLDHGRIPVGSLGTYIQTFRFNGPVFALLSRVTTARFSVGVALLAGLAVAIWRRGKSLALARSTDELAWPDFVSADFVWPMAAVLIFAPVVFPWYLLWLLPFLTSPSTVLINIWTVSIFPVYIMWHFRTVGRPWGALPVWIMLLEYGCVAAAAAIFWLLQGRVRRA